MGRMMMIAMAAFMVVGIAIEQVFSRISETETETETMAANQFISAKRDGEAVPPRPQFQPRERVQRQPETPGECSAERLIPSTHDPINGRVTRVIDGDTFNINVDGIEMAVRLWGIDAPESDQPGGPEARRYLGGLVPPDSLVKVHPLNMDRYGRMVGSVDNGGKWAVNVLMVAYGWAYDYKEYSAGGNGCLGEAERAARGSRMGMWGNQMNRETRPWGHRMKGREG